MYVGNGPPCLADGVPDVYIQYVPVATRERFAGTVLSQQQMMSCWNDD